MATLSVFGNPKIKLSVVCQVETICTRQYLFRLRETSGELVTMGKRMVREGVRSESATRVVYTNQTVFS